MSNRWLQNKSFIQWRLFPTEEDCLYWETFMNDHPDFKDEINESIKLLNSIQLNKKELSPEEKQGILEHVRAKIEKHNRKRRYLLYSAFSAAASIALLLFFFLPSHLAKDRSQIAENITSSMPDSSKNTNEIQLLLGDSKAITIENEANILYNQQGEIVVDASGQQRKTAQQGSKAIEMNTLIVPKGKRSNLTLADGTKVWVNAGSTLRFPSAFTTDKREIWVDGEIYIEVTRNEVQPFYVHTSRMVIDVLGTRFNVTAYQEDAEQAVVLVEGSVNVNVENKKVRLSPDQMLAVSGKTISTQKINAYDYISWKDGLLQFSKEPLSSILLRLSRYYDIPITCDEQQVRDLECNGKLVLFENVEDVLKTIYNTIPINYEIKGNYIVIHKR